MPEKIELQYSDDGSAFLEIPSIRPFKLRFISKDDEAAQKYHLAYSIISGPEKVYYLDASFYAVLKQAALKDMQRILEQEMGYSLISGNIELTKKIIADRKRFSPLESLVANLFLNDKFAATLFAGIYFVPEVREYLLDHHRHDPLSILDQNPKYQDEIWDYCYADSNDFAVLFYFTIYDVASEHEKKNLKGLFDFSESEKRHLDSLGEPLRYSEVFLSFLMPHWAQEISTDEILVSLLAKLTPEQIAHLHHWQQIIRGSIPAFFGDQAEELVKQKAMLKAFDLRAKEIDILFADVETND